MTRVSWLGLALLLGALAAGAAGCSFEQCCMRPVGCCYDTVGPKAAVSDLSSPAELSPSPAWPVAMAY